ncbi:hypothetical protein FisN_28Hh075 [Fistulifera solaris]|uniref:FAS1 domain-containing protein n=1 Tax=Fistulifera solaris TaxID=1519565 RepID=A0A1Z5KH24_FISSO|nr:hypothetical protein FisN_28Hh075 [Fistulifera solaris]|eukprot:GAX25603.1 hypothetical protein FisN_28Hh075 [Fistulifera solaris]
MKLFLSLLAALMATTTAQDASILDAVANTPDLSTLGTAIGLAGLEEYLSSPNSSLTVFAPHNAALESLPAEYLTPNYVVHLQSLLEMHIVEGAVPSSNITDFASFEAISGDVLIATVNDQGITFSGDVFFGAQVVTPDIIGGASIIHIVNKYFLPAALNYDLFDLSTSLIGFDQIRLLITEAGLEDELREENRTILAPSDIAFDLLSDDLVTQVANNPGFRNDLVLYHIIIGCYPSALIVDGLQVMTALGETMNFTVVDNGGTKQVIAVGSLNQVVVQQGDQIASNGIGHSLGGVLEVPMRTMPVENQTTEAPVASPTMDVALPTSEAGDTESPMESASEAPVAAPTVTVNPPAPTQSNALALSAGWMFVVGGVLAFF